MNCDGCPKLDFVPADAYASTFRAALRIVLDSSIAHGLREYDRTDLSMRLTEEKIRAYVGLQFRPTDDLDATLYLSMKEDGETYMPYVDPEGNLWHRYKLHAEVSWPSWGGTEPDLAIERLAHMRDVAELASRLVRKFPEPVWQLYKTREQHERDEAARAIRVAKERVEDLVRKNAKGMKVGQEKRVYGTPAVPDFADAIEVERSEGGRTFKYRATGANDGSFCFVRTA